SGQAVSVELQLSPLRPGEVYQIPLKITGDADAYELTVAATNGGAPVPVEGSTHTLTFDANTSTDSFTFTLTPPYNDDDLVFDVVNVEIDRDGLLPGFIPGKSSWRVEIPDDQLRKVSWNTRRIVGYETASGSKLTARLFIHPPLPPNEGIGFALHSSRGMWKQTSCASSCTNREIRLDETNTGNDAFSSRGWFTTSNAESQFWMHWTISQDGDPWSETTILTINEGALPSNFAAGEIPALEIFIHDDDR
ncbi:MAG: hypothetical protein OXE98_08790, partial [Hyphomicrobiales bacterium]|nr:hypothetical protein [Hyphomicrobiales bacterium]